LADGCDQVLGTLDGEHSILGGDLCVAWRSPCVLGENFPLVSPVGGVGLVAGDVPGDGENPRSPSAASSVALVAADVSGDAQPGLGGGVLGIGLVAEVGVGVPVHPVDPCAVERGESVEVALGCEGSEVFVWCHWAPLRVARL